MTNQAGNLSDHSTEIPEHILTALQVLAPEQRQQAFAFIEFLYQSQQATPQQQPIAPKKQRVFGQYAGKISMSEDFDDPLPDSFWLGES
ncbi:unknown protein [Leptolyngbya sp. NIES-3755]|nr:unknown protein [Leptolyngbya sp. NIES-3755]